MNRRSRNYDYYERESHKPFRRLYRDRVNGKFLGVCTGIANYFGIDPVVIRIVWIILTLFWWYVMIPSYFIMYIILDDSPADDEEFAQDPEAVSRYRRRKRRRSHHSRSGNDRQEEHQEEFYGTRQRVSYVKRDIARMEKKVGLLESYVTSQRFQLDKEFQNLGP